jgi:outer membrane protein TolC
MGNSNVVKFVIAGLVAWIASTIPAPAFAQEQHAAVLDLPRLVEKVLERNAGLTARQLQVKAMKELADSADALDDPRLSYAIAPSSFGDDIPSDFGNALGVRQVIQFSQAFPWPGKRALRAEEAAAQAQVSEYSYDELHLTLVSQSRLLWSRLWYADKALAANTGHQQLLTGLEGIVTTQYGNGLGLQQDVLATQTALVELTHQQIVLEQEQRRLKARLNALLNQPAATPLDMPDATLPERELPALAVLQGWILEAQPELLALEAQATAAEKRLALTEKEDYPDIQFNVVYNELWNASPLRLQVGVSVNIPLDFGKRTSRKAAARYRHTSLVSDLAQLKSRLGSELEQQLSSYEELTHNIALFDSDLIPKAHQTYAAASANYEGGGGNFATLVAAQRQLLDLNLHLLRMRAEKMMTLVEIDRLSGGRLWPAGADNTEENRP